MQFYFIKFSCCFIGSIFAKFNRRGHIRYLERIFRLLDWQISKNEDGQLEATPSAVSGWFEGSFRMLPHFQESKKARLMTH
jgi:hypothetical protein